MVLCTCDSNSMYAKGTGTVLFFVSLWLFSLSPKDVLRTVPIIVIAHTFCASRDTRISYRGCLLIQGYFCAAQNYPEKAELRKCSWYRKRTLGVTTHFSEIIKLEFGKELHTLLCILKLFTNIVD